MDEGSRRLKSLYNISKFMSSTIELDELLDIIMDSVIEELQADTGSLMLLSEKKEELYIRVARGLAKDVVESTKVKLGYGISGFVAKNKEPLLLVGTVKDPKLKKIMEEEREEIKSALCVPLLIKDEVIGTLSVKRIERDGDFSQDDLELLSLFGVHAATSIENDRLFKQQKRRVEELIRISTVSRIINSLLDKEQIFDLLSRVLREMVGFSICSLGLVEDSGTAVLTVKTAEKIEDFPSLTDQIKENLIQTFSVLSDSQIKETKVEVQEMENFDKKRSIKKIRSFLTAPLIVKDQVNGLISIGSQFENAYESEDLRILSTLANQAAIAIENTTLYTRLQDAYISTIKSFMAAVEARDVYTKGHSEKVTKFSIEVAKRMGLDKDEIEAIHDAGLLHDIGKIGISDATLRKPGRLTDSEYNLIKNHPQIGVHIVESIKKLGKVIPLIYYHHERYDGKGYLYGLKGEDIPLGARILAVADAFDAMTSDRPYRKAMKKELALEEIKKNAGKQFDPKVVEVFLSLYGENEEG
ncbi:MAG: GAF domain-containing protein [bacterium]|nr:GAF domain-containing protein [bacterium]